MLNLSEAELLARDAERNLDEELLASVREMKAGLVGRVSVVTRDGRVVESPVARARLVWRVPWQQPGFAQSSEAPPSKSAMRQRLEWNITWG